MKKKKNKVHGKGSAVSTAVVAGLVVFCLLTASPGGAFNLSERVHKTVLPNGIRLLVVERPLSPTVSLYLRHPVGALDEESGYTGAAHLLEHMMFKGTTSIGTIDFEVESQLRRRLEALRHERRLLLKENEADRKALDRLDREINRLEQQKGTYIITNEIDRLYREQGALGLNAATGYDMTSYMVNMPVHTIELWARIEADRLINPVFREFLPERNVVIEERRQTVDSQPRQQLMELFLGTAYIAHPYGRPIIGWESDIRALDKEYLEHFFRNHYSPADMVITVVGGVSTDEAVSLVEQYFGLLDGNGKNRRAARNITTEPPQRGERRAVLTTVASPSLLMGFHKPTLPAFEDYVFDVIDVILSGGRSSRLYRSLVTEQAIAASVSTSNGYPGARHDNLFIVSADPLAGRTLDELESAIYAELQLLKEEPLTERELRKAKNQITTDFLRRIDSNSGLASLLSYYEVLTGDYRYITTYLDTIESITTKDIMAAAIARFTPLNRTVAVIVPEPKP